MHHTPSRPSPLSGCLTRLRGVCIGAGLAAMMAGGIASAAVDLRIEARPAATPGSTSPITVFTSVTNGTTPVTNLTASDFTVRVGPTGSSLSAVSSVLTAPAVAPGSPQRVSVVFAMDYSSSVTDAALPQMQAAVTAFINNMQSGDYASIVKFNGALGATVVQPFVQISPPNTALTNALQSPYAGIGTNLFDAVVLSTSQFTSPPPGVTLPQGPKAIVIVSDGGENSSTAELNDALRAANDAGISIFSIGIGDFASTARTQLLTDLATQTSGEFFPAPANNQIADVYLRVETLLSNEYRLTFPSGIADCASYTMEVTVTGQTPVTDTFTRCVPVFSPDIVGLTRSQAITALTTAGLVLGTETEASSETVPVGSVISQTPAANQPVAAGSAVNVVISTGPLPRVPNLVGLTQAAATTEITSRRLVVGTVTQQSSSTVAAGLVISSTPGTNTQVAVGSAVNLVISTGPSPSSGRGGGGSTGLLEILAGLGLLGFARRRKVKAD